MPNYLTSAYALRIKAIFNNIEKGIPGRLKNKSLIKNRESITKFVIDPVKKAYTEGVRFAEASSGKVSNKTRAVISDKDKRELFEKFILRIKIAESVFKNKIENRKKILKLEKNKDKKDGSQRERIKKEYLNGVRTAVNNIIINAGRKGYRQVWTKINKIIEELENA